MNLIVTKIWGESGLTLVELMVTLGVYAILMASLTPIAAQIMTAYRLHGATRQVFAELQNARFSAVAENHRYRFTIVQGSPAYAIHRDRNNDGVQNDGVDAVMARSVGVDAAGVTLSGTSNINFLSNGTVVTPGSIVLHGPGGKTASVAVGPGGRIRIE